MVRNEIWKDDDKQLNRRLSIYSVISHILYTLNILLHPISPFITEYLHHKLFNNRPILEQTWPKINTNLMDDQLESDFEILQLIISQSNSARMQGKLKRRWPLKSAYVYLNVQYVENISKYKQLLQKLCNVQNIEFISEIDKIPVNVSISPNYKLLGKKLKSDVNEFRNVIQQQNALNLLKHFDKNDDFKLEINKTIYNISKNEITFSFSAQNNFVLSEKSGFIVALTKERDSNLFIDGYLRDLARRIQSERKQLGLDPTEILNNTFIFGIDTETQKLLLPKLSELEYLIRTKTVEIVDSPDDKYEWKNIDIDGKQLKISIVRS